MSAEPVLVVERLEAGFLAGREFLTAVDGVSLAVTPGETLAIVGESGCGKSVLAYAMLRLVKAESGRIRGGRVMLDGTDLLSLKDDEIRAVRGRDISMIFQEPSTSLNPVLTIGTQLAEAILAHEGIGADDARHRSIELLRLVGIADPERRFREYPHQLSGGMRQRVMIAIALACQPKVLVADEPTTALDVTIQAQVLDLIDELKARFGMGVVLITHNLGVVAGWAQRVVVMYAGRAVEEGDTADILHRPLHPYTQALLRCLPDPDPALDPPRLLEIEGMVPGLRDIPAACAFAGRCPLAEPVCRTVRPELVEVAPGRRVACHVAVRELAAA